MTNHSATSAPPLFLPQRSRFWMPLLCLGIALLGVGIALLVAYENRPYVRFDVAMDDNLVVYVTPVDPLGGPARERLAAGGGVFHHQSCRHRTRADLPVALAVATKNKHLPCLECFSPTYERFSEPVRAAAANITTLAGLALMLVAVMILLVNRHRRSRCPRCGCRRKIHFCARCGARLSTKGLAPQRSVRASAGSDPITRGF